jgi:hypothetical protein
VRGDLGSPSSLHAIEALVKPADGRADRGAVGADFALLHELFHERPERVVLHLRHADVVELEHVDAVGVQALERFFHRVADERDGEILRDFALALALLAVGVEVVADLRGDDDLVALRGEGLGDELLAVAVAVGVGGVEERDAEVVRLVHQRDGLALGEVAPPAGGDGPKAEADLGNADVGLRQRAKFHVPILRQPPARGKAGGKLVGGAFSHPPRLIGARAKSSDKSIAIARRKT